MNERSDTQIFWLTLIRDKFGIICPEDYIVFEKRVEIDNVKFIDAYIPSTGIIIEQKSPGKDLNAAFTQAKNYHDWLPLSQRGRYIITSDFNEIHVHDMEAPTEPPVIIPAEEANRDNLSFLLKPGETRPLEVTVSVKAGELAKDLYESLLDSLDQIAEEHHYDKAQYKNARNEINVFCVRLVFLLYAEDSGLFAKKQFQSYLEARRITARDSLRKLFIVLNQKPEEREVNLEEELKAFPCVDGGLFKDNVDFPQLTDSELDIIIKEMAEGFNWAKISPVIFGAIFEATLNDETRHTSGMHYTSPDNIHKVIDPLFLDDINDELNAILSETETDSRTQKLIAFQEKLSRLAFLDPACGSGNFLTESYLSLRKVENRIIAAIPENQRPEVKVKISQFHGIEYHDFAVNVARTALWISEHQMLKATQLITNSHESPLPLKKYDNIQWGDALSIGLLDKGWDIEHDSMLYIMGNPPFLGYSQLDKAQRAHVKEFFGQSKSDYVACWFAIAAQYVQDKRIKAAFVATNSVVQGEQVAFVFKPILARWTFKIDFAYHPFKWHNELPEQDKMAQVTVVVVCFSTCPPEWRKLYTPEGLKLVKNINFYLAEGPDEDIAESEEEALYEYAPRIISGNTPADGGNLIINNEVYDEFLRKQPGAAKYLRRYMMGKEFIHDIPRWCLWLVGASPQEIHDMPLVYKRVKAVQAFRRASTRPTTKKLADRPTLFAEIRQPESGNFIAIPVVSSERREYIPMGWLDSSVIVGNKLHIIPGATVYDFGILTSRVHMAWMRRVTGRMRMDYSYSNKVVYNTFIWPEVSVKERARIEGTAQKILDAREMSRGSSFASLYDDVSMPEELRRAHRENDAAVCRAYGWDEDIEEEEIVKRLFVLYHEAKRRRAGKE